MKLKGFRGSISIFLVLILLPMFCLAGITIDTSKVLASKNIVSGAGDLAMNGALAQYNQALKDVYGLTALSSSTPNLNESVHNYFVESINATSNETHDEAYSGFLKLEIKDFGLGFVAESSLSNPEVLKEQILEYMKLRGPISISKDAIGKFSYFVDIIAQYVNISNSLNFDIKSPEIQAGCELLFQYLKSQGLVAETSNGKAESDNVNGSEQQYAGVNSFEEFIQTLQTNFDKISVFVDVESVEVGKFVESILLTEYITEMFSCATSGITEEFVTLSGYTQTCETSVMFNSEVEYILWGNADAQENINSTKALLFVIRFTLNSMYAFSSPEINTETLAVATVIAGWSGFAVPIVQNALKFGLALSESLYDVSILMMGLEVPIYKTPETWHSSLNGTGASLGDLIQIGVGVTPIDPGLCLTYQEYLKFFVLTATLNENYEEEMLKRVAEVIELNLSSGASVQSSKGSIEKNPDFNISECYTIVSTTAVVGVDTLFLGKISSFDSLEPTSFNIDYYGILGY